ncbi:hypothetical protein UA08_06484 [Talaromyces atroroseus]|uniref:NECAP PHear domain-containing protein n=1 Tax=Talaromyces atroroseus TaxID=1441469 RepID=A0A225ALL4_TALAT|nr:hypothetical protein UA08_06484 [Talaromyces atroroseus]OKL58138.1 hypothetical protein UA08_06484 [Talaromyces atroroseus]
MSAAINPATGQSLPADALQRVLFVTRLVHVYTVPPLASMKGYTAADWTVPDAQTGRTRQIFSARLLILETAIHGKVTADILLEDADNGTLFAAAPYTDVGAVEHVLDSSRFFVLRVVGEGRKALLGIGFEDRSDAFDFGVALQETRKILGIADGATASDKQQKLPSGQNSTSLSSTSTSLSSTSSSTSSPSLSQSTPTDYSLKPGQTISIHGGRRRPAATTTADPFSAEAKTSARAEEQALFSIPPPPAPGATASSTITSADQTSRRKRPTSAIIATENRPILGFEDSATFD